MRSEHGLVLSKVGSNRYTASIPGGVLFFSYETPVAAVIGNQYFRTEVRHSVTTSSHINKWLPGEAELRPQAFFNALEAGEDPEAVEAPFDPEKDVQVSIGGITLLIQQPGNSRGTTRMVDDEEGFVDALAEEVEGFKSIDARPIYFNGHYVQDAPSITNICGIIAVVVEVPNDCTDLTAYANRKSQEISLVWERFAE